MMKVKPFYCKTEGLTAKQVQDVFDKCVDAVELTYDKIDAHLGIIPTETPEEKEALDTINPVEWNGEGLPPIGIECEFNHPDFKWTECITIGKFREKMVCAPNGGGFYEGDVEDFRPIETPQQREEREAVESLREAIQALEDLGKPVYFRSSPIRGALIQGGFTELNEGEDA